MLAATTISAAGSDGAKRCSAISSASPMRPTASGRHCVSGRSAASVHDLWSVWPVPVGTPNIFGSWPTITSIAIPVTKPTSTGRERKSAMKPRRRTPDAIITPPETSARAASSTGT